MRDVSLVIGSTGLVGSRLINELAIKGNHVIAVSRRPLEDLPDNVEVLNINFEEFLENGICPNCDHLYICLGTTIKKAGSKKDFRRIDLDYCVSFAKKAKETGATKISLISSIGANIESKNFYLQTKGELEEAIKNIDFQKIHIFRPGLLIGDRNEIRYLEKFGQYFSLLINTILVGPLRKYRSIKAELVAFRMANALSVGRIQYFYFDDFYSG